MGAVIASTRAPLLNRRPARALAAGLALLALACSIAWDASTACAATPATTPSVPASAQVQPPSTTAATATAATPTTTYAPSGGASVPGSSPAAGVSTAATAPAATAPAASAPATSTPATPGAQAVAPAQKSTAPAKAGKGDRPLSTGAIVIAVLAALLVLACGAWALARSSAFEPHWLLSLRHAMAEAGFRASATWSEFADWARIGR
jgi:hypothetical protein